MYIFNSNVIIQVFKAEGYLTLLQVGLSSEDDITLPAQKPFTMVMSPNKRKIRMECYKRLAFCLPFA